MMLRTNLTAGILVDNCYSRSNNRDRLKVLPICVIFSFVGFIVVFISPGRQDGKLLKLTGLGLIVLGVAMFFFMCHWSFQQIPTVARNAWCQGRRQTPVWSHRQTRNNPVAIIRTTTIEEPVQIPTSEVMASPGRDASVPEWQEIPLTPSPSPPPKYEPPPSYEEALMLQAHRK